MYTFSNLYKNVFKKLKSHIYISTQYIVEAPLAEIYSLKFLWYDATGTPVFGEFLPFFPADPLKLCQVGWGASVTFRSLQRYSIGFKSRL